MSDSGRPGARRAARLAVVLVAAALVGGCGAGRRPGPSVEPAAQSVGVYRGTITRGSDPERAFSVRLFARLPDRLHAEVAGPVGGPRLIVDGGGGRIAVTVVSERTAYVGPAGPDGTGCALGVRLSLSSLVAALLVGDTPQDARRFDRDPPSGEGWPRLLRVETGDVSLVLERRRVRALPEGRGEGLGTGRPPPGVGIEPLDLLCERLGDGPLLDGREESP